MKCVLNRAELLKALAHASSVVERGNTIPVVANVLLQAEGGALRLVATDLDLQIDLTVPAQVERGGEVTVSANMMHDLMRNLPEGAQVEIEYGDGKLAVRSGRSRYNLATLPATDFPLLQTQDMPVSFEVPAETLLGMLERVEFAQSKEIARYHICCVCLQRDEDRLVAIGLDGFQLAWSTCEMPPEGREFNEALLGSKMVRKLMGLLDGAEGNVRLSFDERRVKAVIGESIVISKLVDAKFPDWRRAVPETNDKKLKIDRDALLAAIRRAQVVANEKSRIAKIELSRDKLTLSMTSPDGLAVEEAPASYEADALTIGFNTRYLTNTLGVIDADELEVAFGDARSPTLFTNPNDAASKWVVYPFAL